MHRTRDHHGAREFRCGRAVLSRVVIRTDLARVLNGESGFAARNPADLERMRPTFLAYCRSRRERGRRPAILRGGESARTAQAELPVALVVASPLVDPGKEVPGPPQVPVW